MFEYLCRYRRGIVVKIALLAIALPLIVYAFNSDPPVGSTGGFGESNCTQSGCHVGSVNPSGGQVVIVAPQTYAPGTTTPIQVRIEDSASGRRRWGFQLTARFSNARQAGSFATATPVGVQLGIGQIQYAGHRPSQVLAGNSFTYTVMWTAPADASGGDVQFHAAGNAANGDGTNSGDRIFLTSAVSTAPSTTPARIFSGGIVNAASFVAAPSNTGAPGALISIFGENLATAEGGAVSLPLPTVINGTRVLINNVPAPLVFVSPGQINAQVPFAAEVAAGSTANVVVESSGRPNSSPEPLRIESVSPGIFTTTQNGTGPGAILKQDNVTLVSASAPARPGETVVMFVNGLGQTQPPALVSGAAGAGQPTLATPTVTIGGQNARVDFSGAAPGFAGLYQINAVVPTFTSANDYEVRITISDVQSRAGATVRVQP